MDEKSLTESKNDEEQSFYLENDQMLTFKVINSSHHIKKVVCTSEFTDESQSQITLPITSDNESSDKQYRPHLSGKITTKFAQFTDLNTYLNPRTAVIENKQLDNPFNCRAIFNTFD